MVEILQNQIERLGASVHGEKQPGIINVDMDFLHPHRKIIIHPGFFEVLFHRCSNIEPRVLCHTISMPAGFDSPVSLEMKHIGYEKPRDMRNILWDIFTHCCLVLYNTPDLIEQ